MFRVVTLYGRETLSAMTPCLDIRVALFLLILGGFSRSATLSQIVRPTAALVNKRLQLPEHKSSTFEPPVFDSLAYSTFVQNKETNSRLNRERRKIQTDKRKMRVKHQRTMTGYKNSLIFSQKEREVRPAALRGGNFKYGQNNWINYVNEIGVKVHSGEQAFRKHNFHRLVRFQNVNMVDNVAGENDYQSNYVKFGFRRENAKNIRSQKSMFLRKLAILTRKLNEFSLNRTTLSNFTERTHYPEYNSITRELNKAFAVTKPMQYPTQRPGKVTEILAHLSGTINTIINEINRILTRKLYELCTGKRTKKGSFTQFKTNKTIHRPTSSDALVGVAGFMLAEGLVLHRIARSVPRRSIDQTDLLNSETLLFSKVDENKISNLRHKAQVLPKIYQRVSMEIIEERLKSLSCRTLKQLLAHTKSLHTSADDIVLGRSQDNQSIPQDLHESLALLRLLRNTSKQQSEQETSKTGVVNNIFRRLRSADPTNRRPRPATLTNRVSESAINSLVIKTINTLIAHLYELRRTVATLFPEITIVQNQTNLFLDSVLASRSKEIIAKEVKKKIQNEIKKLKLLCLYLSKMPIERLKELVNPQSQTSKVLNNQQSFQNLPEEKITRKSTNCGHIVSGILRNIIRKKRHAPLKEEKVPSYTAVSEIALKTLADLIAKVFRLYSAISAYLPKLSGHVEVNVTNVLSEVTEFKDSPGNVFARKALKAIRVTAEEIYEIMEILVLASRPKKSQDVTKLIDEHTILAALLGALGHVLQWALNLTDIMLDDLTRNETYSFGSGVQVTVGKTEDANDVNNVTAEIFLKLTPKLSNAFETILKNILPKDVHVNKMNVTSVTQTTSRRSTWKKRRKYDDIYETRRLVSPHHFKNNFYKRSFYRQFRKVPLSAECQRRSKVSPEEYGVYHIQKGILTRKLDPRDLENPSELPVDGLESVHRLKNMDVALEFSFKHPLMMSAINFKRPSNDQHGYVKLATIYVELQKERNAWSPLLDYDTKNVMLFKVSSQLLLHLPPSHDAVSGIRLYPQQWSSNRPFIVRPSFIFCVLNT